MQIVKLLRPGDPEVIRGISGGNPPEIRRQGYCTF